MLADQEVRNPSEVTTGQLPKTPPKTTVSCVSLWKKFKTDKNLAVAF
jgi:hypothetical protein